jgi:hypothetical protein
MPFRSYTIVISNPSGIPRIATQSKDSVTSRVLSLCLRSFTSWMASRLVLDTLKKMFRSWTDYCPSKLPNECGCFLKASGMWITWYSKPNVICNIPKSSPFWCYGMLWFTIAQRAPTVGRRPSQPQWLTVACCRKAKWLRIWCRRPVSMRTSSRVNEHHWNCA